MVETEKEEETRGGEGLDLGEEEQELMLHVVRGMAEPHTLKIRGHIAGLPVLALIDSGASHNFISEDIVQRLKMKGDEEQTFWVRLGDGRRRKTAGICKAIALNLEGVELAADFHVFPLGGVDVILGVAWLKTLGNIKLNWDSLSMEFKYGDRNVTVKGEQKKELSSNSGDSHGSFSGVDFWGLLLSSTQHQPQIWAKEEEEGELKAATIQQLLN